MKNRSKCLFIVFFMATTAINAQFYSVKTNLLGLASTNLNIEGAVSVHRNWSLHLPLNYNPWVFSGNKRFQNVTVQPGARYWFLETYSQGFIGFQTMYSRFHVSDLKKYRYDGNGFGAGISYGYSKVLKKRWNIEFEAGIGFLWADYTKYLCKSCGAPIIQEQRMYVVPSKAAISLVYLF